MKKNIFKIIILFIFIFIGLTTISSVRAEIYLPEKTEEYKKWESLSPEERENTIQPSYYSIGIKASLKRSRYNILLAGDTSLESVFDLSKQYLTIVKNQKSTGTCWSFSATSILESTMAVRNNLFGKEYSPLHMEYVAYQMYNKPLGFGGNMTMAMAYMVNGKGPVLESDFPMESVYDTDNNSDSNYYLTDIEKVDLNKTVQLKITKTTAFPSIFKQYDSETEEISYTDGASKTYTLEEVEVARQKIKSHIKEYGAVAASMYMTFGTNSNGESYYDAENNIYCYTGSSISNHQVALVGWDDNKKAYIAQNSYGESFGNGGYFYISYDDVRIEEDIYGINDLEELSENNNYDNIYQYDELGLNCSLYCTDPAVYYANVFSRDNSIENKNEYITEVGLYIEDTTGIEIYVNPNDGEFVDENNNSKLKLVHSGEVLEPGYHVIKINATDDTKLTGEKFIIMAKSINQEGTIIPVETNTYESGFSTVSTIYDTARANEGESLISFDGLEWEEINGIQIPMQVGNQIKKVTLTNTNVCVRAFTKYVDKSAETVLVTGVELDKTSLTLKEGETENLTATVLPDNATNKNVTWAISDESIATIANGVVTAVKAGTATITVTTEDGDYTATAQITVEPKIINAIGVMLAPATAKIEEEKTVTLTATVLPDNATNKNVTWTSSDESVATVSSGVVTAIKAGTATITVKTEDGNYTATAQITVEPKTINVTGVTLNNQEESIKIGETCTLLATALPSNATNKNVTWTSSDESVATVSSGVVTGVKAGETTITVKTEDGNHTATCRITVEENAPQKVDVTSVSLNKTSETLKIGKTLNLVPTILPLDATNKNVTWKSSDESVATVSSGVVTGIKEGKTTITVTTEDGNRTATCEITVEKDVVNVTSVELNKSNETLKVEETLNLIETISPVDATNKNVTWTSSDESVATVSSGVVTALRAGTATITVTTEDGNHTATCKVTVEEKEIKVAGINISQNTVELEEGATANLDIEIVPSNATNKNITWESSDEEVVKIVNGVITALKPGTATITVITEDGGFKETCEVTVVEKKTTIVKVESINLNKTELQMEVSDKSTLIITFNPELPTNTTIKWESSNTKVATVDENGIVKAVGKGTAIITATSEDGGYVAECKVTVTKKVDDPDDIYKQPEEDTSTSNNPLPNTGITTVMFLIAAILLIAMGYSFIKYIRLRDVK